MPSDERYRVWAMRRAPGPAVPPVPSQPDLGRADLARVSRCPARRGFRELHFSVGGAEWSWCFPSAGEAVSRAAGPAIRALLLRPGPHGLAAHAVSGQGPGRQPLAQIGLADAADLAISGIPVFIHATLLRHAVSGTAGPGLWEEDRQCVH